MASIRRLWALAAVLVALGCGPLPAAAAGGDVDLALVLLVDISGSMDFDEQKTQRDGYVQAFRHPEVISAIRDGLLGRIAVTYVEWSDPWIQYQVMPWTVIDGAAASVAFADRLAEAPINRARSTSISSALLFAAQLLDDSGFRATRRAIDVSGDGPNNNGPYVAPTRDQVVKKNITINGLPITIRFDAGRVIPGADIPNLEQYYRDCVIGGPNAFLFTVNTIRDFPVAIRRKLIQEIAFLPPPPGRGVTLAQSPPKADCLAGERSRGGGFQFFPIVPPDFGPPAGGGGPAPTVPVPLPRP
ncbi:MAG: DUF1194 domain-containing protein [Bauldia sp.]